MKETKIERMARLLTRLADLGFTYSEAKRLRRIEMTLQRWAERECGDDHGCIERDEATGKPYWLDSSSMRRTPIADREAGALRHLAAIMSAHPELVAYHQSDCWGCMLYILRKSDIAAGESIDQVYTRGVAVCA